MSAHTKRFEMTIRTLIECTVVGATTPAAHAQNDGDAPRVFSPGVISSSAAEQSPAFSPDGNTVYFARRNIVQSAIMVSHRKENTWSAPTIAAFSGIWRDIEPTMAPDGSYLVFASNRPQNGGGPIDGSWGGKAYPGRGGNLWKVERTLGGWSDAVRLPDTINGTTSTFSPSIAADGSIYFMRAESSGKFRLYYSKYSEGSYKQPVALPFSDGASDDSDPTVAPDESLIVYGSDRDHVGHNDLFIVFRRGGTWGKPMNLGTGINGEGGANNDTEARLGADHTTLYFSNSTVMPVRFPRSREQALRDSDRMLAWDNGSQNIWYVSLKKWLDTKAPDIPGAPSRP